MGVIARRTLLEMLTRAGILPDDVDVDAEQGRIAQELSRRQGRGERLTLAGVSAAAGGQARAMRRSGQKKRRLMRAA